MSLLDKLKKTSTVKSTAVLSDSALFNKKDIIFSSDSIKMIKKAESFGAKSPYIRSKKLTKNSTKIIDVILDFFFLSDR